MVNERVQIVEIRDRGNIGKVHNNRNESSMYTQISIKLGIFHSFFKGERVIKWLECTSGMLSAHFLSILK